MADKSKKVNARGKFPLDSYESQYRQDRYIDYLLKRSSGGIFLDIGAYDGITISNSYFFEKKRNWTGICIEPVPHLAEKLKLNRKCVVENCSGIRKER
jgi:hypothetical protein